MTIVTHSCTKTFRHNPVISLALQCFSQERLNMWTGKAWDSTPNPTGRGWPAQQPESQSPQTAHYIKSSLSLHCVKDALFLSHTLMGLNWPVGHASLMCNCLLFAQSRHFQVPVGLYLSDQRCLLFMLCTLLRRGDTALVILGDAAMGSHPTQRGHRVFAVHKGWRVSTTNTPSATPGSQHGSKGWPPSLKGRVQGAR